MSRAITNLSHVSRMSIADASRSGAGDLSRFVTEFTTGSNQAHEATMALREFRDRSGIEWKVWDTTPERMHASPASDRALGDLRGGWITFSSTLGRRRLAPLPVGWENLPSHELERLCEQATPTKRHSGEAATPTGELQAVNPDFQRRRPND